MREIAFSIPVTGTIWIENGILRIKVNETATTMKLEPGQEVGGRLILERGSSLFDLVLDVAKAYVREKGTSEFTGAQLYHMALEKYPELNLKRNSWGAHVMSCAPNHPSYHHYTSQRRYFRYLGKGRYSLDESVLGDNNSPPPRKKAKRG